MADPEGPHAPSLVDESPAKPRKKKKKPAPTGNAQEAKYEPGATKQPKELTRVSVKPNANVPELARIGSGSVRQLAVTAPEGGYSTGYYRVLLESKHVETLCRSLSLQYRHVAQLHRLFKSEDDYNTGEITIDEFFHAIHDEKRPLTLGIFAYVGLDAKIRRLKFDDFVLCVVTFAALSRKELLHYAFTIFDKDESGIMDMKELRDFYGGLKNKNAFFFQKNVDIAQKKLAEKDHTSPGMRHHAVGAGADGLVDFEDLQEGSEHFQVAFFPLVQFQRNIQTAALGEAFWSDVVYKKSQIERVVHYMRVHEGHLPPLSIGTQLAAMAKYAVFLMTGGGAMTVFNGGPIALRRAAITKYAEEMRQRKLEEDARKAAKEEEKRQLLAEREAEEKAHADDAAATPVETYTHAEPGGASDHEPSTSSDHHHVKKKPTGDASTQKKKKKAPKKAVAVAE